MVIVISSHMLLSSRLSNIFGRVCLSVCLSVCLRSTCLTIEPTGLKFGTDIKDHHIPDEIHGHRSKVKVTKVFSLVSEKVQSKGHRGQGHKGQRS